MKELVPTFYRYTISGKVDISIIAKYLGAGRLINEECSFEILLRTVKDGDEEKYHHAYDYLALDKNLLPATHSFNLLALVNLLIQWEWAIYNIDILDNDFEKQFSYYYPVRSGKTPEIHKSLNLATALKEELGDLISLMDAKQSDIQITIDYPSRLRQGALIATNLQSKSEHLIKSLIKAKFDDIRNSYGFYLTGEFLALKTPDYNKIVALYNECLNYDFTPAKAIILFRRLVVSKVLEYLNEENVSITPKGEDVTIEQAKIIYPLLAVFNLLNTQKHINKHKTERDRTKFIRSIIQSPRQNRKNHRDPIKTFPSLKII